MSSRGLRRAVRNVVEVVPGAKDTAKLARDAARLERDVKFVLGTGVFDREWYEAQSGRVFETDSRAIRHYLRSGRRVGHSPHPLFEPTSASRSWRKSNYDPFVEELRRTRRKRGRPHPVSTFRTPAETTDFVTWARKATPETLVPVVGGEPITWANYRSAALEVAADQAVQWQIANAAEPLNVRPRFARDQSTGAVGTVPGEPAVSIIMPTWNRAHLLKRAVESVHAQSLPDWELIIVDDGSDDDTALVLEGMSAHDSRVRSIVVDHGGVCRARNAGLAAAKGRYIAFLDSDNTWTPQFLQAAVDFADTKGAQWAHAGIEMRRADTVRWRNFEGDREHLLVGNYIDLNVVIARRSALETVGGFDETLRRAVDYDLVLRLSKLSPPRLIPVLGAIYRQDDDDENRISVAEPFAWNALVKLRHLAKETHTSVPTTVPGRTSIIVPVRSRSGAAVELIGTLADTPGDVEVIVVLCGSTDWAGRVIRSVAINRPNVHVIAWPGELNYAASINLGAGRASGEFLVGWRPNCRPTPGWREPLLAAFSESDVGQAQPLNIAANGLIDSAGAVFVAPDVTPSPLLAGMPVEDATKLRFADVPSVLSDVFALRKADFDASGGLDPLYGNSFAEVEFGMRLRDTVTPRSVLASESVVYRADPARYSFTPDPSASVRILRRRHATPPGSDDVWRQADFDVLGRSIETLPAGPRTPEEEGAIPIVRPRVSENPSQLRWAIDIAAPAGPSGDQWGDWHFARSLARSLEKLGQRVHVDRREARTEGHRALDDVTLVLRGLDDVRPRPGARSMLWVISHPDLVSEAEAASHDVVFAASEFWADVTSKRWGVPIEPLMQCTDADLFRFGAGEPDTGPEFVFVGNSRGVRRLAVVAGLDAGLPLSVYGRGWRGVIPDEAFRGDYIANEDLPALYASAGVVFNDHWDDMRHDGFVSNRLFDVLAAGGRIVSDDVPGLEHLFGSAVPVFHSHVDLKNLFEGDWRDSFPSTEQRREVSDRVRAEHSFDARAQTLLDTALRLRVTDPA